jgi:hypothetical protein
VADLKPRIDKLVGSLSRARRPAGQAQAQLPASPPLLRAGDPGFAEEVARLVAMHLDQYAREGAQLEIRVPWQAETLWLVPEGRDTEALDREGVDRGRVWTARELMEVMALPDLAADTVRTIAIAKMTFGGNIVKIKRR